LSPSTPYYYRVSTYNSAGESAFSTEANATTQNPPGYQLSVAKAGTGASLGSVSSSPAGIACGGTCSASYNAGTAVTLTVSVLAGSSFTGWSGACTGAGACSVTMDQARSVTATFGTIVATKLYLVTPCRVVDTRAWKMIDPAVVKRGVFGDGETRAYTFSTSTDCTSLSSDAKAWVVNIQFRPSETAAYLTAYPVGVEPPLVSALVGYPESWTVNNAVVPAGSGGAFNIFCQYAGDVIIDVSGYFK
jgi:hypothetical protein